MAGIYFFVQYFCNVLAKLGNKQRVSYWKNRLNLVE